MRTRVKTKLIIVLVILVGAIIAVTPSVTDSLPSWWTKLLPSKAVQLGLDLKGGMELLLEVQTDEAVNNALTRMASDMKTSMREENIRLRRAETTAFNHLLVEVRRDKYRDEAAAFIGDEFPGVDVAEETETTLVVSFPMDEVERLKENAVVQALYRPAFLACRLEEGEQVTLRRLEDRLRERHLVRLELKRRDL